MSTTGIVLLGVGLLSGTLLMWRVPRVPRRTAPELARTVSVIVPARNEERNLPRLLASLADQTHPPLELLVVDDGSTDGTAAAASRAGARVLTAPPPPEGWLGKPWACHLGAASATGERLLFLDADTWLAQDGLARLVAAHEESVPRGLLSVQPHHVVERPYEHLSAVCNTVSVMASGMAAVRPARSARVAFGPCLLTRAAALAAVGGFQSVAGQVVEDAALARSYRDARRPVRCLGGGDAVRFRMYPDGPGSLVEGWVKNLSGGAARAGWLPLLGAIAWVSAGLSIAFEPGLSVVHAAAWAAFALHLWWMLRRVGTFHPLTAVLFPVPLVAFAYFFLRSVVGRWLGIPVAWRGREVDARRGTIV